MTVPTRTEVRAAFEASVAPARTARKRYWPWMAASAVILAVPLSFLWKYPGDTALKFTGICVGVGLALFIFALAKIQFAFKAIPCPACHQRIVARIAGFCPQCGGVLNRPGKVISPYRGDYRDCTECGKRMMFTGSKARLPTFEMHYCTFCSAYLSDKKDFILGK